MDRPSTAKVRFVCISDTHNAAPGEGYTLPKGDVLIHAGDLTNQGSYDELKKAAVWIAKADFEVKIVVAGNHDLSLDQNYQLKHATGWRVESEDTSKCQNLLASIPNVTYLNHAPATITLQRNGHIVPIKIFGSPYSPHRGKQNWAFQYSPHEAEDLWRSIPDDIDVLITHTPPQGHVDASAHWKEGGCAALKAALNRMKPAVHVCGHCHEGRGAETVSWEGEDVKRWVDPGEGSKKQSLFNLRALERGKETAVVNASIMAKSWGRGKKESNKPIVVDIDFPISTLDRGSGLDGDEVRELFNDDEMHPRSYGVVQNLQPHLCE